MHKIFVYFVFLSPFFFSVTYFKRIVPSFLSPQCFPHTATLSSPDAFRPICYQFLSILILVVSTIVAGATSPEFTFGHSAIGSRREEDKKAVGEVQSCPKR